MKASFARILYYRLNVINLALPPLRERKEDIPPLVEHFLPEVRRENEKFLDRRRQRVCLRFEPDAMQLLLDYNWPGNVRELENAVERAVVLASQATVPADVLPDSILQEGGVKIRRDASGMLPADASLPEILADFERRKIIEALDSVNWSQTDAAEKLHIPLSTLNQKIKRLSIDVRRKGGGAGANGSAHYSCSLGEIEQFVAKTNTRHTRQACNRITVKPLVWNRDCSFQHSSYDSIDHAFHPKYTSIRSRGRGLLGANTGDQN